MVRFERWKIEYTLVCLSAVSLLSLTIVNTHFLFKVYEYLLEFYIHFLDRFGMEVHFTRYLYFAIAGGDS